MKVWKVRVNCTNLSIHWIRSNYWFIYTWICFPVVWKTFYFFLFYHLTFEFVFIFLLFLFFVCSLLLFSFVNGWRGRVLAHVILKMTVYTRMTHNRRQFLWLFSWSCARKKKNIWTKNKNKKTSTLFLRLFLLNVCGDTLRHFVSLFIIIFVQFYFFFFWCPRSSSMSIWSKHSIHVCTSCMNNNKTIFLRLWKSTHDRIYFDRVHHYHPMPLSNELYHGHSKRRRMVQM